MCFFIELLAKLYDLCCIVEGIVALKLGLGGIG